LNIEYRVWQQWYYMWNEEAYVTKKNGSLTT
jgi:hypothetical protein